MTTSNHLLVGSLIAVTIKEPALVVPLAFLSHFVLDMLPHYGYNGNGYGVAIQHKTTYYMEGFGLLAILALLATGIYGWNIILLAALLAVSPDFEWPYRYFFFERKGVVPRDTLFTKFHKKIQWGERWWGIFIEIPFFIAGYLILLTLTS